MIQLQQGIAVMADGELVVNNNTPARKSRPPTFASPPANYSAREPRIERPKTEPRDICGAMSQQRYNNGPESAPQKLVQLVGCRHPKARTEPWVRPVARP